MKKYKLIKIYPGSPELDTELFFWEGRWRVSKNYANYFMIGHPVDYPDNWQEVIEKDYEILSYISKLKNCIVEPNDEWLKHGDWDIHSIKRLSDGEVFTVGDKLSWNNTKPFILNKITLGNDEILLWSKYVNDMEGYVSLKKDIQHIKNPLFTTEDGVDIFKDDDFHIVIKPYDSENWNVCKQVAGGYYLKNKPIELCFSTKEAAEEYILINKSCLSLNDIMNISVPCASKKWLEDNGYSQNRANTFKFKKDKLKQLVKSKL